MSNPSLVAEDIEAASQAILASGSLCFVTGFITNTGFAASISFNSQVHESPRGTLAIALREATLTFFAPVAAVAWHEDVSELIRTTARTIQVKESINRKDTASASHTRERYAEVGVRPKLPLFGEINFGGRLRRERKAERGGEKNSSTEQTRSLSVQDVEMQQRSDTAFELTFRSEMDGDLVAYNAALSRLNVLAFETPSEVKAKDVRVVLRSAISETDMEVQHSLRVRSATGCWKGLQRSANHQIIGEILLAKLLRPVHEPKVVWPKEPA